MHKGKKIEGFQNVHYYGLNKVERKFCVSECSQAGIEEQHVCEMYQRLLCMKRYTPRYSS